MHATLVRATGLALTATRALSARIGSPVGTAALVGAGLGGGLVALAHLPVAALGHGLPTEAGLAFAAAVGLFVGTESPAGRRLARRHPVALLGLFALWTTALPWLVHASLAPAALFTPETLAAPVAGFAYALCAGLVLLVVPIACAAAWPSVAASVLHAATDDGTTNRDHAESADRTARAAHAGLALGMLTLVLATGPWVGTHLAAVLPAGLAVVGFFLRVRFAKNATQVYAPNAAVAETITPVERPAGPEFGKRPVGLVGVALLGATGGLVDRVAAQLTPAGDDLALAGLAALVAGAWLGTRLVAGAPRASTSVSVPLGLRDAVADLAPFAAAAMGSAWLAGFPGLVQAALWWKVGVSSEAGLLAFRLAVPLATWGAIGCLWAASRGGLARHAPAETSSLDARVWHAPAFVTGVCLARWILVPGAGVATGLVLVSLGLTVVGLVRRALRRRSDRLGRGARLASVSCAVFVAAGLFAAPTYDPGRAARLLFSTQVLAAAQANVPHDLLGHLDESRLLAVREGDRGTCTLWTGYGGRFELRESGLPKALVSRDPGECPELATAVVQAVLPLVLHPQPDRVLLLGLGGGVTLDAVLAFPVSEAVCVERDPLLPRLVREEIWSHRTAGSATAADPLGDRRVRLVPLDPMLAVACRQEAYDAILVDADQSTALTTTALQTREFYARAASHLAPGGVFCQRFADVDYGPGPLRTVVRTMQSVFARVVAIEPAPGEFLLLATGSPDGFAAERLTVGLQGSHVRRLLARTGRDWASLVALPGHDHEALAEFASHGPQAVHSLSDGRLAWNLPREVQRWGRKWIETRELLAERAATFADWIPADEAEIRTVRDRIAELQLQQEVVARHPDEPWAYRQVLKERVRKSERSVIKSVGSGYEKAHHPEDRRRLDYVLALSTAAQSRPTDLEAVRAVATFESPYDPLVSYFLHHETAELLRKVGPRPGAEELHHRLHAIWFAPATDRSVRNVADALRLTAEVPHAVPDPVERGDRLDGLMQMLKQRWDARSTAAHAEKSGPVVLNDIEASLSAMEAAWRVLDEAEADPATARPGWPARRRYLELVLERPLRAYRTRVLNHHLESQRKTRELLERAVPEPGRTPSGSPASPPPPLAN